jgi:hypothetical protein
MLEYRGIQNSTAYMSDVANGSFKSVKRWARIPAKKPVMNIASD